jgi:hypothetical protein
MIRRPASLSHPATRRLTAQSGDPDAWGTTHGFSQLPLKIPVSLSRRRVGPRTANSRSGYSLPYQTSPNSITAVFGAGCKRVSR